MKNLMKISRYIDGFTDWVARFAMWLALAAVLVSAANAVMRKALSLSSNAFLEMQWYLFSAFFLLGASYALKKGAHVKIDVLSSRLSNNFQLLIDCLGTVFFLIPFCTTVIYYSYPIFLNTLISGETSENAGGLIRWPVYFAVLASFSLLIAQGVSELIKTLDRLLNGCSPESQGESK